MTDAVMLWNEPNTMPLRGDPIDPEWTRVAATLRTRAPSPAVAR